MKRLKPHKSSQHKVPADAADAPPSVRHPQRHASGEPEHDAVHRGQARIAYRFAAAYRNRMIYVRGIGWLVWDGARWTEDTLDRASEHVLEVVRSALNDQRVDEGLRSDARRCESSAGIRGVLKIASSISEMRVRPGQLDADPFLFNVSNGTLDLRTGQLRRHDPADLITKVTDGGYRPEGQSGAWSQFLATVLPDSATREYFQRVIGQATYGDVREHLFPLLTGAGANGKSTAYGAIDNALGDYSTIIDPAMLVGTNRGVGGPEMMDLRGARLVFGSETDDGRRLNTALMKRLTGGDSITARNHYAPTVTWRPTHQLVYVTNHPPQVDGKDPAVWRRVRVLPFNVTIPARQRDPELPEKLRRASDEVVTWAVRGWFDYSGRGAMDEPEHVTIATDNYRTESDSVRRFVRDMCIVGERCSALTRELYIAWDAWSEAEGVEKLSETAFAGELERLGFPGKRTKHGTVRSGLKVSGSKS